jgi:hypothetical protein
MKKNRNRLAVVTAAVVALAAVLSFAVSCASQPKERQTLLSDKGSVDKIPAPEWLNPFISQGILAVEALPQYKDRYCFVGQSTGSDLEFALALAKQYDIQSQMAEMARTTVGGKLKAGQAGQGTLDNEIDNYVDVLLNVSYSGAQRINDWWRHVRTYDPDEKGVYTDQYQVYVLFAIPKKTMNQAIAAALETSIARDSELYDITINLARQLAGVETYDLRSGDSSAPAASAGTVSQAAAGSTAKVSLRNSRGPSQFVSTVNIFDGTATRGQPRISHTAQILPDREAEWELAEGSYTFVVYYNNAETEWAHATVGVTAGDSYLADARDYFNFSFSKR